MSDELSNTDLYAVEIESISPSVQNYITTVITKAFDNIDDAKVYDLFAEDEKAGLLKNKQS